MGREEGARHRHQPEHVGVELRAQALVGQLEQRAHETVAGVVHQHVDPLSRCQLVDPRHRRRQRGRVVHVERDSGETSGIADLGFQRLEELALPSGGEHADPLRGEVHGGGPPDSSGGAGDEDGARGRAERRAAGRHGGHDRACAHAQVAPLFALTRKELRYRPHPCFATVRKPQDLPAEVTVATLADHVGQEVTLQGWLYNKRSSGKLHFLEVRDGTGIVQCVVFKGDVTPELFEKADKLAQETSLRVVGTVKEHGKRAGTYEVQVKDVAVIAAPSREYPISNKEHGTDFLMDNRHLWLRSRRQHAILRIPSRHREGHPRLLRSERVHPHRRAHLHPQRGRRDEHPLPDRLPTAIRPSSPSLDSCTSRRRRRRSGRYTASVPPSARRRARRAGTWPSSGWSSRRSPS